MRKAWMCGLLWGHLMLTALWLVSGRQKNGVPEMHRAVLGDASEEGTDQKEPAKENPSSGETKRIALTFDDGPHKRYTEELLDGLAERDVKATFFLLGSNIEGKEEIVERMAREGHLIGNHTFYHVDITRLKYDEACQEICRTSEEITEITGQPVEYVRPPFGNWNKELECDVMMIPIFWSVDPKDWTTGNVDQIVQKVVTNVEENDIILLHDSYDSSVRAALRIIDLLEPAGFEFVTADQLILE